MRIFFLLSFLESAFLPVPIESLSIPLLTARKNPWPIAFWGSVSSILGCIVGFLIGCFLLSTVGEWMISNYGMTEKFAEIKQVASENTAKGSWIVFLGAVSPIPFKLVSIAAGAIGFPFLIFLLIASIGRSLRFAAFAVAFHFFGDQLRGWVKTRPRMMTIIIVAVMVLGFALLFI